MMGLDSIWNYEGNYLTSRKEKFDARSTGCSCCSVTLDTEKEVRKEAIESLVEILLAAKYFGWSLKGMITEASQDEKLKKFKS